MTDPAATAEPTETTIKRFLCRHILTSGRRCGSPALRGESFCYYHHTTRRPAPRHHGVHPEHATFELPAIDDRAGVQFAIAHILNRIATDQLDHKRSGRLLHGLFIASRNLQRDPRPAAARSDTRDSASSRSYVCRSSSSSSSRDSSSFSSRESSPFSEDNEPGPLVEDLILDEDLGPIAPIAEIPPPQAPEAPRSLSQMMQDFFQSNPSPDQQPDPNPPSLSSRSAPSLSSRSEPSLSSRSAAEGSASPHSPIPQPAQSEAVKAQSEAVKTQSEAAKTQSEAVKTQSEAVIPTGAADGCIVRRAVEGPPHLNSAPQPATSNPQPSPPSKPSPKPPPSALLEPRAARPV
jgi:hypothetical protein